MRTFGAQLEGGKIPWYFYVFYWVEWQASFPWWSSICCRVLCYPTSSMGCFALLYIEKMHLPHCRKMTKYKLTTLPGGKRNLNNFFLNMNSIWSICKTKLQMFFLKCLCDWSNFYFQITVPDHPQWFQLQKLPGHLAVHFLRYVGVISAIFDVFS